MAYGRCTPVRYMRCAPVRGTPVKWPMRDARLWDGLCEMHAYERRAHELAAYERHAYEMTPARSTSTRDTPMRWSMGDVCLGDAFNRPIQVAFAIWDPQMASLLVTAKLKFLGGPLLRSTFCKRLSFHLIFIYPSSFKGRNRYHSSHTCI